jgi:peptidoglycan/xylan/chitin deacetylase (PgdA/CDA1 family)
MALHHRLMAQAYRVHKVGKSIGRSLGLVSGDALRVLTYHDVAPQHLAQFEAQIRWLSQSWKFVSAEQFAALICGAEPLRGRNVLLTFDDGYASQRRAAEQVLKPLGIAALFFVVLDFVSLTDRTAARQFIARHIYPLVGADELPPHAYNMGWSDLEALLEQGHTIGAHTRTHARLALIDTEAQLEGEIITSADALAQRLRVPVDHFAYTFGDLASFSPRALAVARRRFRCIYSGLRGDNAGGVSPFAVRREAVGADDPLDLLGAYVEGVADFRYARSRARLASWI